MWSTPAGDVRMSIEVQPGGGWSGVIECGSILRIVDLEGAQAVDFLCYNALDYEERYHAPNTLKKAGRLRLSTGNSLYSDAARPIFTLVGDTHTAHDTIGGCCSAESNRMLYGVDNAPGCRETFLRELEQFGMGRKDIVPNVNFFCDVPVHDEYELLEGVFREGRSKVGDYVDLRAEMDALAVISNCQQTNNPCNSGRPSPIGLLVYVPR
jgi:urea carboxylase-associated protein 1